MSDKSCSEGVNVELGKDNRNDVGRVQGMLFFDSLLNVLKRLNISIDENEVITSFSKELCHYYACSVTSSVDDCVVFVFDNPIICSFNCAVKELPGVEDGPQVT